MKRGEIKALETFFGKNFIGPEQVNILLEVMGLPLLKEEDIPEMNYELDLLQSKVSDYLLVMGYAGIKDSPLNIIKFRDTFGVDPEKKEPCLYNQDWYLAEDFVNDTLEKRWYLVKKDVIEESRAVLPAELLGKNIFFPSAILCVYVFFAYYYAHNEYLWWHDFVWCCDTDHNGDRIYVGKYHDVDGVNKNGFSIHRHLALRKCYACVNAL